MTNLRRHVPELALEWAVENPDARWQLLDGTLCFADISGFTALAERLALRGRVGGEELVETLGRVFGRMLDIVSERRGELIKFGGDALLLFFRGEDHVLNAASAAIEIRSALREEAEVPTSVGPLRLSMSVGLHSGPVYFFLVGMEHRELILLGPSVNRVVQTEDSAHAGQIRVSAETSRLLPKGATRPIDGNGYLLRWRKARGVPPGAERPISIPEDMIRTLFAQALGRYLERGGIEPEHKVACIAFAKFTGTDSILDYKGPDALARELDLLISDAQKSFSQEDVTLLAVDVDEDGGKLFAGAGVPFGLEDDEGSMLRAMTKLLQTERALNVQVGVNRGHVFVAEIGSDCAAAYSAMGDTTNTAARIAGKAPYNRIYAHPSVLDECLTLYEVKPSESFHMKGKTAPLVVYEIGEELGLREREGLSEVPFSGRDQELDLLADTFALLREGRGGVVSVEGDSGLGKSRLLQEALLRSDFRPLLSVRGEPYGANSAYRALRDPLRNLLKIERGPPDVMAAALEASVAGIDRALLPLIGLLGPLLQIPVVESDVVSALDAQYRPRRSAELVAELIQRRGGTESIILVDDAHWLDDASAQLLNYLSGRAEADRCLILVGRRSTTSGFIPDASIALVLEPLADESVRSLLLAASEAAPLRPHVLEQIIRRVSGNPLFAMEVLKAVREEGSFEAVPLSLEAAMAAQVDALDPDIRRILRYGSVLGRSFSRLVLAEVMAAEGYNLTDAMLGMLSSFLEVDGSERLRFKSGIVRDTTYESVAYRSRLRLHRSAGETMERLAADPELAADSLALHFHRAGDAARAWRYARLAAARAMSAYANTEATNYFEIALDVARELDDLPPEEVIHIMRSLGESRERSGEYEKALDAFAKAIRLARDDALVKADLLLLQAGIKERMRRPTAALSDLTRGRKAVASLTSDEAARVRARIQAFRAMFLQGQGKLGEAIKAARRSIEDARKVGDNTTLGQALNAMGWATLMTEGPENDQFFRESLEAYRLAGDLVMQATVISNLGVVCAMAGRWSEGVDLFREAMEVSRRVGDEVGAAATAQNLGEMLVKQNRFDEAETVLQEALRVLQASGYLEAAGPEVLLARVLMHRGELEEAEDSLKDVIGAFIQTDQPLLALEASAVLAECQLLMGRPDDALEQLDSAIERAGDDAEYVLAVTAISRADALIEMNRYEEAEEEIVAGLEAARQNQLPYEEAMLRTARIELRRRRGATPESEDSDVADAIFKQLDVLKTA